MAGEYQVGQEKFVKLPAWARERITYLETANAPAAEEISRLRKENAALKSQVRAKEDKISAMVEIFGCAAKGGSEVAKEIHKIVENWIVDDAE